MLNFIINILPHVFAVLSVYLLISALKECFKGKLPPAPAAIGRAFGIIVFGQLVGFFILWYLSFLFRNYLDTALTTQELAVLHGPIGIIFISLAGYISMRTFEDTKSMNIKIVALGAIIIQGIITAFNFNEGISPNLAFFVSIPSVLIGGYIFKRESNRPIPLSHTE